MSSNAGDKVVFFLAGAGIGAAIALLFAPKTGRETREILARKASEGAQFVQAGSRRFAEEASGLVEKSKETIQRQKEGITAAFEAGKQAYMEEKGRGASAE